MNELPYLAEYAKSSRAKCKGCKDPIEQGSLRIAVMVQSAFHDGKQPNWHHEECFFKKQRPKTAADIGKLNTLRHADQKRVKETIENSGFAIVMPTEKGKGKGKKRSNNDSNAAALRDFAVEYSKSSRATCRVCEIKICKNEVRVSKTVYDSEVGQKFGGQPLWHHVKCFAENRENLLFLAGGEDLPGYKGLSKEDQAMVKAEIKPMKSNEIPVKKLKAEPKDETEVKQEKDFEKKIQKQNELFFKYRDALSEYLVRELRELMEVNTGLELSIGKEESLNCLADYMAFGATEPCEVCGNGLYQLDTYGYKCTGHMNEWTACSNITQNPKRKPMVVPKAFKSSSAFKKYKPKVGERLFESAPPPAFVIVKKEEPSSTNDTKKARPIPPLKNLQFFLYGKLKNKEELKNRILKLGGLVTSKPTDTLAAVICSKTYLDSMPDKMQEIQQLDIEVVEENFIDLIDAEKGTIAEALELIVKHNNASWGSDPAKRIPQDVKDGKSIPKSGSMYVKSSSSKSTKLKLKGGTAVDPDSGLEDVAHVYKDEEGTKFSVVLGKTDVVAKKNSYYKMQILEDDKKKKYWVFRAWGRIGTTIGGNKLEDFKSVSKAISMFEEYYMEKTENPWECRDMFQKVPGRYYPIDVDYGEDDVDTKTLELDKTCKLPVPVQQLMLTIFDIKNMKQTLLEFELDTEKMPLGKLSKKQIKAGYKVLSELLKNLQSGQVNNPNIIDATNRFYTLIPHNFGVKDPPLLDNEDLIKTKTAMLDNMLEIEIAYSLMKTESGDTTSPVEAHYQKLKAEIVPLEKDTDEWKMLITYVQNTHAATHTQYTLEVQQIFKVVREGEDKRYKPFKKLHNRRLLWHGSRTTNFAGILSQGLRIAPPEAPATGYMFGKGIYFADMVSKSANYCCTNKANPVGVMLLCETALGEMKECTKAEYVQSLPPGQHSVWGKGRTMPDPEQNRVLECGTVVPLGKPVDVNISTSLLYNEFIVYDVAQVKVKYLFEMKFNYKY